MILTGKRVLVTGASQGIGKAIARLFHGNGAAIFMVGRSVARLKAASADFASDTAPAPELLEADLNLGNEVARLADRLISSLDSLHVLVNCGGIYTREPWKEASIDAFGRLLQTNVLGPYLLTQKLLPLLQQGRGDIVFINSSIVNSSGAGTSQYAAGHHARRSLADSLRAEVNENGIRVLSVYPGRTATPLQASVYAQEGKAYDADRLLQPDDIAKAVLACVCLAATAEVTDLHIRPRYKR